eukprot:m.161138 g.161138  ORF g.161138 m.161138 type:complete len:616 (-) comp15192_c1_seq4:27-1874(-)
MPVLSPPPFPSSASAAGPSEPISFALSPSRSREDISFSAPDRSLRGSLSLPDEATPLVLVDTAYRVAHDINVRTTKEPLYQIMRAEATYYRRHFVGKDHWNFFSPQGVILSVRVEGGAVSDEELPHVRVVLRTADTTRRQRLPVSAFQSPLNPANILSVIEPSLAQIALKPVLSRGDDPTSILLDMDEHRLHETFKFALLCVREGQTSEETMLLTDDLPPAAAPFLDMLCGTRASRAGVIETQWDGYTVLFHTPALMPRDATGSTTTRRRHISHCTVALVFLDTTTPLRSEIFSSHLLHVLIVVRPAGPAAYRVAVAAKHGVGWFDPPCEDGQLFAAGPDLRRFLLVKLINAEVSAMQTETFSRVARRTRATLLHAAVETFEGLAARVPSPTLGPSFARTGSVHSVNTSGMGDAGLVSNPAAARGATPSPSSQRSATDDGRRSGDELARHVNARLGPLDSLRRDDDEDEHDLGPTLRRGWSQRRKLSRNPSLTSADRDSTTPDFHRTPSDALSLDFDREPILGQGDAAVFTSDLPRLDAPALREMIGRLHQEAITLRREKHEMVQANLKLRRKIADLKQSVTETHTRLEAATNENVGLTQRVRQLEIELDAPAEV